MRVVLTAEEVGGRQAELGKTRSIGATTDDVIIRFESSGREGLPSQLNRTHIVAQPVSHVAILFADVAANARPRLGRLQPSAKAAQDFTLRRQPVHFEIPQDEFHDGPLSPALDTGRMNEALSFLGCLRCT